MKKIIRSSRIINGQSDLERSITEKLTDVPEELLKPAQAVIINLGNGTTGYVYEEDGWIFMVESAEQASAYSNMDELADHIASTWRD